MNNIASEIRWDRNLTNAEKIEKFNQFGLKLYCVSYDVTVGYGLSDMTGYSIPVGEYDTLDEAMDVLSTCRHGFGFEGRDGRGYAMVTNMATGEVVADNSTTRGYFGERY